MRFIIVLLALTALVQARLVIFKSCVELTNADGLTLSFMDGYWYTIKQDAAYSW